jgi:hypothetical protein
MALTCGNALRSNLNQDLKGTLTDRHVGRERAPAATLATRNGQKTRDVPNAETSLVERGEAFTSGALPTRDTCCTKHLRGLVRRK